MRGALLSRPFPGAVPAALVLCPLLLAACAGEDDFFQRRETAKLNELADEYLQGYFRYNPVVATEVGVHDYDDVIGPVDREQIFGERSRLRDALESMKRIEVRFLAPDDKIDYQVLDYHIQGRLLDIDSIGYWARDPGYYNDLICRGIDSLLRKPGPLEDRLRSIIARERQVPTVLENARDIIETVPRILGRIAVDEFEASLVYFEDYLPSAVEGVSDPALLEEFRTANEAVIDAYRDYIEFLNDEVLGDLQYRYADFFLGQRFFQEALLYNELLEMSFDEALEYGEDELERARMAMEEIAREIDPEKSVAEILEERSPAASEDPDLFSALEHELQNVMQFASERDLVTIPAGRVPAPARMPPFMQPLNLVAPDPSGLYGAEGRETYIYLSLPDAGANPREAEAHLRDYSPGALALIAASQGPPGLYLAAQQRSQNPRRIRQILRSPAFPRGWAIYAEGLLLEAGYAGGEPRLRLEHQRRRAAAMARLVAGLNLHTLKMNLDDAVDFLSEQAYLEPGRAAREARLAVRKPLRAAAVLSEKAILDLRAQADRDGVAARDFHDRLLADGIPPGIHTLRTWSDPELRPSADAGGGGT